MLSDYRGRHVLLYYMGDFTSSRGWRGALALGQLKERFRQHDILVLVVGCGSRLQPANRLAASISLPYPIYADINGQIARCYDLNGRDSGALILIDAQGFVRYQRRTNGADLIIGIEALLLTISYLTGPDLVSPSNVFSRPSINPAKKSLNYENYL